MEWNIYSTGRKKPKGFGEKIKSKERNKKIGKANSKPKPKGFGKKMSIINKGKKRDKKFINDLIKRKSKPVIQYNIDMEFIKEWESVTIASKSTGISKVTIAGNARNNGINKSAGGFKWEYKKDE